MKYKITISEIQEPVEGRGYCNTTLYEQTVVETVDSSMELDVVDRVIRAVNNIQPQK